MAKWEVEWQMTGTAVIEADNEDEAEELACDALRDFTTYTFDEFEVDEVTANPGDEVPEDD